MWRALRDLIDAERRRRVGEAINEGYRRIPQSPDELNAAQAATEAMIAEEPW